MKRLAVLAIMVVATALGFAAPAVAKKLPIGEAQLTARITMAKFTQSRGDLGYPKRVQCVRSAKRRVRCTGLATGAEERYSIRCSFVAIVVNKRVRLNYGSYWKARGRLTKRKCQTTQKPYLEESAAEVAAVTVGSEQTGLPVTVEYLYRMSDTVFRGRIRWTRQTGPNPWEGVACSADATVELKPDRLVYVTVGRQTCY